MGIRSSSQIDNLAPLPILDSANHFGRLADGGLFDQGKNDRQRRLDLSVIPLGQSRFEQVEAAVEIFPSFGKDYLITDSCENLTFKIMGAARLYRAALLGAQC
jgi:hypothetical protein